MAASSLKPQRLDHALAPGRPASLEAIAAQAAAFARAAHAPKTRKLYESNWHRFRAWCRQQGLTPLPATPQTVGLYIAASVSGLEGLTPRSMDQHLAAIADAHRRAGHALDRRHEAIVAVLAGAKRTVKRPPGRASALLRDDMLRILETCDGSLRGVRDRALILLGFYGARRRVEICAVDVEHLKERRQGYVLTIPSSKTDQEGEGARILLPRQKPPPLCPVQAIRTWMHLADIDKGPLFRPIDRWGTVQFTRLTPQSVGLILKARARQAGFKRTEVFWIRSHSLRAGHITTATLKGKPDRLIQRQSLHKSLDAMREYIREGEMLGESSADGLLT